MSERSEKSVSRSDRPTVTPTPTSQRLFNWIEDKFDGPTNFARSLDLRMSSKGGKEYRLESLHAQEFKANNRKPERAEMVEIANKFLSIAQEHCNEIGKSQEFVILAVNHMKSAHPYGLFMTKLKPTLIDGAVSGNDGSSPGGGGDDEISSDAAHRDRLLTHSHQHMQSSDEHIRFMQEGIYKSTGTIISMLMDANKELREENKSLRAMQFEWTKAMNEAADTKQDREMKAAMNEMKIGMLKRGTDIVMQMIPVVAKTLERNKTGALPVPGEAISVSAESIAIRQFIEALTEGQKAALFGTIDAETKVHTPNILTVEQVQIFDAVASLRAAPSVLSMLMPGGEHEITMAQVAEAQKHVPMEMLMPLFAIMREGQRIQPGEQQT